MAPPILSIRNAAISFGGNPLFENVELSLGPDARACLVGRNGSGKSTLLKILAGALISDSGDLFRQPGTTVSYLPQSERVSPGVTTNAFVGAPPGMSAPESHRVDEMLDRLELDGATDVANLSGGEARRVHLARALIGAPNILLLDEPTNHLDLPTILWLERELSDIKAALLIISHDRAFLGNLTNETFWLRKDRLITAPVGYRNFDKWADQLAHDEEKAADRLKQKIRAEEHWHIHGVTARRKRNQGRLSRLGEMRAERAALLNTVGTTRLTAMTGGASGRLVIDAEEISKNYDGTQVIKPFSTRVVRGDRIGIVGPNGSGKTTLVNLLTGKLPTDSGHIRLGSGLTQSHFTQNRETLDPEETLWRTLVPQGGDSIDVAGRQRHVVSYLKEFLFDEAQANTPVKTLSGGEQNRLVLAMNLARAANLMILDEPTNDLDMETLDVLEDMLSGYDGTLLLVSHDRDFLDRIVTSTIVLDGHGGAEEHAGGYGIAVTAAKRAGNGKAKKKQPRERQQTEARKKKLSFNEQRELDTLPDTLEKLEAAASGLETALADPMLYSKDPTKHAATAAKLVEIQNALEQAETRWLDLEAQRETLAAEVAG